MSDDSDEQTTDEQKLQIATYFIMSTPVGEVDFVVQDTSKLVADKSIFGEEQITRILQDYNVEHTTAAATPTGHKCSVSSYGMVSPNEFLDPKSGDVLTFDHTRREFTGVSEKKVSVPSEKNAMRALIQTKIDDYIADKYKPKKACATVYVDPLTDNYTVVVAGVNTKISAYWTGGWYSNFVVDLSNRSSKIELKANIKLHVHYFEDGNVQLHSARKKDVILKDGDDDDVASKIVKAIDAIESEYYNGMLHMYVDLHKKTFKSMRRFLPISKQPMEWNIHAHGVGLK